MRGDIQSFVFGIFSVLMVLSIIVPILGYTAHIEIKNFNLDKVDDLTNRLNTCIAEKTQLENVKKVVCDENPLNIFLIFTGMIVGCGLTIYFMVVIKPPLDKIVEDKLKKRYGKA